MVDQHLDNIRLVTHHIIDTVPWETGLHNVNGKAARPKLSLLPQPADRLWPAPNISQPFSSISEFIFSPDPLPPISGLTLELT
ncbi:hypothetical protein J6590_023377 [Homalodisca vitripennis]|nr:hypothetical protein J6590_023377 [Homalodisca vitripennis]